MKQRLLLLGLFVCALACDSANPVAPGGTVLSISANPTQIPLSGGVSTITVTGFKPDGNPLNPGTQILVDTDIGDLFDARVGGNPASIIEVGGNGQAVTYLRSDGRQGMAMVTADLTTGSGGGGGEGGGSAGAQVSVQVGVPMESQETVLISANPTTISVTAQSRISLLGRNSDNTPVSAGRRIRLTSDLGFLVADGGNGRSPVIDSVLTDSNGEAFATFIAGDRGGQGTVSAILGTSEEVMVMIDINAAIDALLLAASPSSVDRIDCDPMGTGGDTVQLTARIRDAQGNPLSGTVVLFDSQNGTFTDDSVSSNNQGEAITTLQVCSDDIENIPSGESFTVRAEATSEGNTREDTVSIRVD